MTTEKVYRLSEEMRDHLIRFHGAEKIMYCDHEGECGVEDCRHDGDHPFIHEAYDTCLFKKGCSNECCCPSVKCKEV